MASSCPTVLVLCVLLLGGIWCIDETAFTKLPCLYESTHYNPLNDQSVSPNPAWVVLPSGQDINVDSLDGVKFMFQDSPVTLMPFLKNGLTDLKCEIKPYFTANTQILWPGVTDTDNAVDSWYICTVQHTGGKFHTAMFFTKLSQTSEKKEDDKHHVLATLMISTKTPHVNPRISESVLLDCAFTVDHRADVSVTWSYRGKGNPELKILSYNGLTKQLQYNWKNVHMEVEELQKGNASLLVTNVAVKSQGLFTCTVSVASLFAEQQIHLQIRESPKVSLNVDSVLILREGDEHKFVCDASNYYPLDVNIEWLRQLPNTGLLPSLLSKVIYSSHKINHNGTYSLSGFFLYQASLQDNGITYTCRVEHESLKKPIKKSVKLIILDSPAWTFVIAVIVLLVLVLLFCLRMYFKERNANKTKPY